MKLIRFLAKVVIVLAVVFFLAYLVVPGIAERFFPLKYEETVRHYAKQYEVDPALVAAVIRAESNFRANVKSSAGAVGLMQLTPDTFDWLRSKTREDQKLAADALTDPEINIKYGVYNLKLLSEKYSDIGAGLAAYNAGRSRVDGWLADSRYSEDGISLTTIPYPETENYIKKVQKYRTVYQYLYFAK